MHLQAEEAWKKVLALEPVESNEPPEKAETESQSTRSDLWPLIDVEAPYGMFWWVFFASWFLLIIWLKVWVGTNLVASKLVLRKSLFGSFRDREGKVQFVRLNQEETRKGPKNSEKQQPFQLALKSKSGFPKTENVFWMKPFHHFPRISIEL